MEGALKCEASFEALVELHRPRVFRFALASLRDRDAVGL
jgi:DNA-directed RNA polymerase specialized sigma24 family protein